MNWKIFTATASLAQVVLIGIAAISVQVWESYAGVLEGGTDSWQISFAIALPATLTGLALVLATLRESRQRMRLIGLALSSGLFLHYFVISSWLLWLEYEFPPRIPLWGLISGGFPVIYEGELRWFTLVSELSVVFLLALALGVFFLFRREREMLVSPNSSTAVDCDSCGKPQENTNKFCTSCGIPLKN
jgi:hypothetical protein